MVLNCCIGTNSRNFCVAPSSPIIEILELPLNFCTISYIGSKQFGLHNFEMHIKIATTAKILDLISLLLPQIGIAFPGNNIRNRRWRHAVVLWNLPNFQTSIFHAHNTLLLIFRNLFRTLSPCLGKLHFRIT